MSNVILNLPPVLLLDEIVEFLNALSFSSWNSI